VLDLADRPGQHRGQRQAITARPDDRDQDRPGRERDDRAARAGRTDPDQRTAGQQHGQRGHQPGDRASALGCPQRVTAHSHAPPSGPGERRDVGRL
jgi:hypothetical protein